MTMPLWRELVRAPLRASAAYQVPGLPDAIHLEANESPYDLSAAARATLQRVLATAPLHRYPDPRAAGLHGLLAGELGIAPNELALGNGSDELIALLCAAFAEPRPGCARASILSPSPSFIVYRTAALAHGLDLVEVPLGPRFEPDAPVLLDAVARARPNLVFLATPNNPTGTEWPRAAIERLLATHPDVITVVDEAYLAYSDAAGCLDLVRAYPHCIVLRTLSKIGLAALRVGYAIGQREVIAELEKVRPPYNVNTLSQRAAEALLSEHRDELNAHVEAVRQERQRLAAALAARGVEVFPSGGNFLFVRCAGAAATVAALAERGVLVRSFDGPGPLGGCIRITVGTQAEDDALLAAWPTRA